MEELIQSRADHAKMLDRIANLNEIGIALSSEQQMPKLLELILSSARRITGADGGTLYLKRRGKLYYKIVQTESLGIDLAGRNASPTEFKPIPLKRKDDTPNLDHVVVYAALKGETVALNDVYNGHGFDFTGPRQFDRQMNYRTRSMLTAPLVADGETIGIIQLINKRGNTGDLDGQFDSHDIDLVHSLASQAAISLTNRRLIADLESLFDSFIKTVAIGIDEKSPHTGQHCRRVPVLTLALADAASQDKLDFADFQLDEQERYNLEVAAWLHDCGKLMTPAHVVEKATKLETFCDRIGVIDTRFEVLKRDAEIEKLKRIIAADNSPEQVTRIETEYTEQLAQLNDDRNLIRICNRGGESMPESMRQRVREIGERHWRNCDGEEAPFFTDEELNQLLIPYGNLNEEERRIINDHIVVTQRILTAMKFPKTMASVPEYAGNHHEHVDGSGYPKGLTRNEMSVPARVMAIADVFEALTAADRPYKDGKQLSESLAILGRMKQKGHIDPDLFELFLREKLYLDYAREFMAPGLIDIDEPDEIPGYPFTMPENQSQS